MERIIKPSLISISGKPKLPGEIYDYYDVIHYTDIIELPNPAYPFNPQLILMFVDSSDLHVETTRIQGALVLVITDNPTLLSKRWLDNQGIFDIVDSTTFSIDPIRRLYVYQSLNSMIVRYQGQRHIDAQTVCRDLYRVIHRSDEATGHHHVNSVRLLPKMYKKMLEMKYPDSIPGGVDLAKEVDAALLHDAGKLFVPKKVLMKPGELTEFEYSVIKKHPQDGRFILHRVGKSLPQIRNWERYAPCAELHHERWDGSGYPYGLQGVQIPIAVRMMSIMDVYDALISKRPYKDPVTHKKAVAMIMDGAGTQFDPKLVEVFLAMEREVVDNASLQEACI